MNSFYNSHASKGIKVGVELRARGGDGVMMRKAIIRELEWGYIPWVLLG